MLYEVGVALVSQLRCNTRQTRDMLVILKGARVRGVPAGCASYAPTTCLLTTLAVTLAVAIALRRTAVIVYVLAPMAGEAAHGFRPRIAGRRSEPLHAHH